MKTVKLILSIFLLGTIKIATAQYANAPPQNPPPANNPTTGYLEFGIGFTQPMSGFASESYAGYGAYALPGNNFSLSLGVPVMHSNFGVAAMYSYNYNRYDINGYVSNIQYSDQANSYYPILQDAYRENIVMGGLYATVPIERLSVDFRLMGGVAFCSLPEVDYGATATSLTASQDFQWDTYGSVSSSFAFDAGASLRYRWGRTVLTVGVDYINANPMFNTTQVYTDQYGNSTYTRTSGSIPISLMSYSLGIGYRLW